MCIIILGIDRTSRKFVGKSEVHYNAFQLRPLSLRVVYDDVSW